MWIGYCIPIGFFAYFQFDFVVLQNGIFNSLVVLFEFSNSNSSNKSESE